MRIARNIFTNKNNNQLSITLPKKKLAKDNKTPIRIIFKVEKVEYKDKEDIFSLKELIKDGRDN